MAGHFVIYLKGVPEQESLVSSLREQGHRVDIEATAAGVLKRVRAETSCSVLILVPGPSALEGTKLRGRILAESSRTRVVVLHDLHAGIRSPRGPRWRFADLSMNDRDVLQLLTGEPSTSPDSEEDGAVRALLATVDVLVGLHEINDPFFASSTHRTAELSLAVARCMGLGGEHLQGLRLASLLRDIGKVGVDQSVFDEPGDLDENQREEMKRHVDASLRLLAHVKFPWSVTPIIRHHHERFDGQGYPDGLKGPEIPVGARILSAVEAFMAMTSGRAHREALSAEQAIAELTREAGLQFDPEVIEKLLEALQERDLSLHDETRPRVLIADRDREFVRWLKMRLSNHGMAVHTLRGPSRLVKKAAKLKPQLILLALDAEGTEGFNARSALQKNDDTCHLPLAFLADSDDRVLRIQALREGVDDYLVKSVDLEELVSRIENVLVRERKRRHTPTERVRGIHGSLADLSIPDLVQMLSIGLKTARVELFYQKSRSTLWFKEGQIRHAESDNGVAGEDVLFSSLLWSEGTFRIEHGQQAPTVTIEHDTTFLLMEGLRRIDERNAGLEDDSEAAAG